jgi:glucuronate isomerase
VHSWTGYLAAHRKRRADFRAAGATATDHGHPTARTAEPPQAKRKRCSADRRRHLVAADAELFRAQMLTEMAR